MQSVDEIRTVLSLVDALKNKVKDDVSEEDLYAICYAIVCKVEKKKVRKPKKENADVGA